MLNVFQTSINPHKIPGINAHVVILQSTGFSKLYFKIQVLFEWLNAKHLELLKQLS